MPKPHTFPTLYDDLKTVSISFLTMHGYLKPNQWRSGTITWTRNGNKTASISFDQLPPGTYAVAVFHDKNNNGILDKNMLGIPLERYGFSNNARETFSAPSFNSASIDLSSDKAIGIYIK